MKKLIYLLAIAVMALALPSCGGSGNSQSSNANLPERKIVRVSTAQQLIDAIGNDTQIIIETSDVLDLEDGIIIDGISNLSIESADERVHLRVHNEQSDVISVYNSQYIDLSDLKLGHNVPRGNCEGFVVSVLNSSNIGISDCSLYGCGLEGLFINKVKNLTAFNLDIYECHDEAVDIRAYESHTDNIVLDRCRIHDCGLAVTVFASDKDTITNVVFNDCKINSYVSYSKGQVFANAPVTFNDCVIETADDISDDTKKYATFNNCKISRIPAKESIEYGHEEYDFRADDEYYEGEYGEEFFGDDPFPVPFFEEEFPEFDESKLKVVTVHNSDELGQALASNTKIVVDSKEPVSLFAIIPINTDSECRLNNIENLVIEGAGAGVELNTTNAFDNVISFTDCRNIVLRNLTLGHDVEPGSCDGNVVKLRSCEGVVIDKCRLYGCGVVGLDAFDSRNIKLLNSEVYECSNNAVSLYDCFNVLVSSTTLRDCPAGVYAGMSVDNIRGVEFDNCVFKALETPVFVESWGIRLVDCKGIPSEMDDPNVFIYNND